MQYKSFMEALKGKQHKLDKNKNGELDAQDFKMLRKEESEETNESFEFNRAAIAKQRLQNLRHSGRKVRGARIANLMRAAGLREEEMDEQDLDQLDEVLSKDATASDWIHDFVHSTNPKFEGKTKKERIKMALGAYYSKQRNEEVEKKDELPFDPPYKKVSGSGTTTDKSGAKHTPMSKVRHMARMAMKKQMKEETDTSEKHEMAETQLHFIKYAAEEILEYIKMGGQIEEWYQNKLSKVQSEVESLHSYIEGESRRLGMKEEVDYTGPVKVKVQVAGSEPHEEKWEDVAKSKKKPVKEEAEQLDELSPNTLTSYARKANIDRHKSNTIRHRAIQMAHGGDDNDQENAQKTWDRETKNIEKRTAGMKSAVSRLKKEDVDMDGNYVFEPMSYKEFAMMIEGRAQYIVKATHKDTGRVKVSNYVADKDESEYGVRSRAEREHRPSGYQIDSIRRKDVEAHGEGDEEETSSTTQKRGRGRPAGSKSGARGPRIK